MDRLVLAGFSFGGWATAAIMTRTQIFRAGVAQSPAPLDLLATDIPGWVQTVARLGFGATPWNALDRHLENSPWHRADRIRSPLLLTHGKADNLSYESSERMFSALSWMGKDAQLLLYEGEPHIVAEWSFDSAVDLARRVLEFVERNTAPRPRAGNR